ncbi:hypothetical protein J7M22_18215 [Candidatus Poribacteria bacterium]|nr:hypothetical protein [Candidatus Poribacteria bacterium]
MKGFTVREFHDFIKILEERPEWREELRRLVLTDELLKLPEMVKELVEAQRRTEERLESLAARVDALAEAQRRTEERLESLAARVDALAEKLESLTARVNALAEKLESLTARVDALAEAQEKTERTLHVLTGDVGQLKGYMLEQQYRQKAFSYFGRIVKRAYVFSSNELAGMIADWVDDGLISREEADEIGQADVILRGRKWKDDKEIYLVVEVSWGVGVSDVERAKKRAGILRKVGFEALPVVAGKVIMEDADILAAEMGVIRVVDGRVMDWP